MDCSTQRSNQPRQGLGKDQTDHSGRQLGQDYQRHSGDARSVCESLEKEIAKYTVHDVQKPLANGYKDAICYGKDEASKDVDLQTAL
jgi:hypothetical protein